MQERKDARGPTRLEPGCVSPVCTEGAGLNVLISMPQIRTIEIWTFGPDRTSTVRLRRRVAPV